MGEITVRVQTHAIDTDYWIGELDEPGCGATVWFLGRVRDSNTGRKVLGIEYDAHIPLAEIKLEELCRRARAMWVADDVRFIVVHRVGFLEAGEYSVILGVAARRRDAAFAASRFAIEELKMTVPIWKKERYSDGSEVWLKGVKLDAE